MNGTYSHPHPKRDEIIRMLNDGVSNRRIEAELHVRRQTIRAIRAELGMKPARGGTSKEEKLAKFSLPPDENGHVGWTGRRMSSGTPSIRHLGVETSAANEVFRMYRGRDALGNVLSECGVKHCLEPEHLSDARDRRLVRMQLRALEGMEPQPWDVCPEGHSWDEHGRVGERLDVYCQACCWARVRRSREWAREESTV